MPGCATLEAVYPPIEVVYGALGMERGMGLEMF
jgi:hypothetical protein